MKLEGKIVGPWVSECRRFWQDLQASLGIKKLALDFRGISFVDSEGMALMREIYAACRPAIIADSPLTRHFAEQIIHPNPAPAEEGN